MNMSGADWLRLLFLSLLWGGSYFFIEVALIELPVMTIVALRVSIAAALLWVLLLISGTKCTLSPAIVLMFLGMSLLNNVIPFSLIVWGQTEITSSLASILNATAPLFAVVVATLFLKDEQLTRRKLFGVALGFIGVVVTIGPDAILEAGSGTRGQLAVLAAGFSYALAGVFGRRFHAMGIKPLCSAAGQVTMSSILVVTYLLVTGEAGDVVHMSTTSWLAIGGLSVLSTALAYILYFGLLASAGATNLMLVTFLIPVTAILLGVLFLGERLRPIEIAGMVVIALALITLDGRVFKRSFPGSREHE